MLKKVISGGQTGADHGGLEGAKIAGLPTGGWIPKYCLTENGVAPSRLTDYGMKEHTSEKYPPRTLANVRDSDGTVIFGNEKSRGSALTIKYCEFENKPVIINPAIRDLIGWIKAYDIEILNVAGNRESSNPGIYYDTRNKIRLTIETMMEAEKVA